MSKEVKLGEIARLETMDIESAGDIFKGADLIRDTMSDQGLIIAQWSYDVRLLLAGVPVVEPGGWHGVAEMSSRKRAERIMAHGFRASDACHAAAQSAAKIPQVYRKLFEAEISTRRKRRTFDPRAGI